MEITRFSPCHVPQVAAIERMCFSQPWSEESLAMPATGEYGCGMVCLEEGAVVAYACMVSVLDEGQIVNVATHPDHRRRGYAREVLLALLELAREQGITTLTLEVRASNCGARSLYRSLGFRDVGTRRDFYTHPREDAIIMLRTEGN